MEFIFEIIGNLCIAACLTGILFNFVNLKNSDMAVKFIVTIILITALCKQLFSANFNFDSIYDYDIEDIQINTIDYVIEEAKDNIKEKISTALKEKNISYTDIDVHINKQKGSAFIEYIEISGVNIYQRDKVIKSLEMDEKIIFGE